jgi:hypothetical protein
VREARLPGRILLPVAISVFLTEVRSHILRSTFCEDLHKERGLQEGETSSCGLETR